MLNVIETMLFRKLGRRSSKSKGSFFENLGELVRQDDDSLSATVFSLLDCSLYHWQGMRSTTG